MSSLTSGQPKAVWAVFFSCIIAFMGLGLVDPILPAIANQLGATPSQVALLFTSYNAIMAVAMLITGVVASRLGTKLTLIVGVVVIATFSTLGGFSNDIWVLVGLRGGWGLGNALFVATALTAIVTLSRNGTAQAIILYEAAIGLGISVGPILGGELGAISWRGPFIGVGVLMVLAFVFLIVFMPGMKKSEAVRPAVSWLDPFRALKHRPLLILGLTAFLYNFGFFTLLAYSPFVMNLDAHGIGYVFLGWGLFLAVTSVFTAPYLKAKLGTNTSMTLMLTLFALTLGVMGWFAHTPWVIMVGVVVCGALQGNNNTLITTAVMNCAPVERSTASAAYSFLRFIGGALAPFLAGKLAELFSPQVPFFVGGVLVLGAAILVLSQRRSLAHVDQAESGHGDPAPAVPAPGTRVVDFMSRNVSPVRLSTPLRDVLMEFSRQHTEGLPVVDDDGRLVAFVGPGTLMRFLYPGEKKTYDLFFTTLVTEAEDEGKILQDKLETPVAELPLVTRPRSLQAGDTLESAVRLLSHHRLREIPVVDGDRKLVGTLSRYDITRQMVSMVVDRSRT